MTRTPTDKDYRWATQDFDPRPENNRVLHELFGKCWHELVDSDGYCSCGEYHNRLIWPDEPNPNYAADPRLVLEGMRERNRLGDFLIFLCRERVTVPESAYRIDVELVEDKTGRLRDLAIEFMKEEMK